MDTQYAHALVTSKIDRRSLLKRTGLLGFAIPLAGGLLSGCSSDDTNSTARVTPAVNASNNAGSTATSSVTELMLTAMDIRFEPTELSAPVGQPVRVTFVNKGSIEHDWEVRGIEVDGLTVVSKPTTFTQRMADRLATATGDGLPYAGASAGEQMVIEFTPTTTGAYDMMCMVPGHREAGMMGTFTITDETASSADHQGDKHAATSTASRSTAGDQSVEEMDRMHESGILAFMRNIESPITQGLGGQPLDYTMDGDVKVFNLTCDVIQWQTDPGKTVEAWTYNGAVPGPEIRVTEGDTIRVNVTNNLPESTSVHWHGVMLPNSMDGVPFITQPPIKPGETFTYEFPIRAGNAGAHMYHSHHNAAKQVTMGLLGAFIIEPKDPSTRPAFDRDYTIILNDGPLGFTINGKGFPATQALTAKKGERVLVRYMNEGLMIHPMHLHGMPMTVFAKDGYLQPMPWLCDTLNIAPGERWEVIIEANEPGVWAFHCHILSHAESEHGMFGMVTALIVDE